MPPKLEAVPLKSVANFRDFGGRTTTDGSVVVRGQLFRSGHFNAVTAEDAAELHALNVRFSVDLRHPTERTRMPNKWEPPLVLFSEAMPAAEASPKPADVSPNHFADPVGRTVMVATYGRIPYDPRFVTAFGKLFRTLADRGGPVIVHCSQGKDRTGIACALLLHVLGVGRDDVFDDYRLMPNHVHLIVVPREEAGFAHAIGEAHR